MEQQPLDKAVKDSLENLEVAYNAAHWEQMELLLHNLPVGEAGAIDAHFDAIIKNKIGKIETPDSALGWAGIAAGLGQAEAIDAQFDTVFNDKLANLKGTTAPNWDSIEHALDGAETADLQFDTQVAAKLQNVYPSYQPSNWQKLVATLNANFAIREKLYRYKLIEATLMILLLLNFYQYLPNNTISTSQDSIHQEIFEPKPAEKLIIPTPAPTEKVATPAKQVQQASKVKEPVKPKQSIAATPPFDADNADNKVTNVETSAFIVESNLVARNYTILNKLPLSNATSIYHKSGLSITVSEMNQHLTAYTETGNTLISTVPSLRPNFVESQYITPLDCKDCKYNKIPARLRLGLVAN